MLWEYYRRAKTVDLITEYAQIYKQYGRINLEGNAFLFRFVVIIATGVHLALEEVLAAEGFMKEQIFLPDMAYQLDLLAMALLKRKAGIVLVDGASAFATFIIITIITLT